MTHFKISDAGCMELVLPVQKDYEWTLCADRSQMVPITTSSDMDLHSENLKENKKKSNAQCTEHRSCSTLRSTFTPEKRFQEGYLAFNTSKLSRLRTSPTIVVYPATESSPDRRELRADSVYLKTRRWYPYSSLWSADQRRCFFISEQVPEHLKPINPAQVIANAVIKSESTPSTESRSASRQRSHRGSSAKRLEKDQKPDPKLSVCLFEHPQKEQYNPLWGDEELEKTMDD